MSIYVGFDCYAYPGLSEMIWLRQNTNLTWCGYYFSPAPSHYKDASWMGRRKEILGAGWGIAPLYVGQQSSGPGGRTLTSEQGLADGGQASSMAVLEGFAPGSYIYLDIEDGSAVGASMSEYVKSWVASVVQEDYSPGIYCSYRIAASVVAVIGGMNVSVKPRVWAFCLDDSFPNPYTGDLTLLPSPDPARSGYADAVAIQYAQNIHFQLPASSPRAALKLDLSAAESPNPSVGSAETYANHREFHTRPAIAPRILKRRS